MTPLPVFEEALTRIGDAAGPVELETVEIQDGKGSDDDVRAAVYAGMLDLLIERLSNEAEQEVVAAALVRGLRIVRSAEPPLHFAHAEQANTIREHELAARMRGRSNAVTRDWMIPRLRRDIEAYRAHIRALKAALATTGGAG